MFLNTNPPLLLWQIKMISYQKMFTSCTQNFQNCWSYMDQIVYACFVLHGPDCICLFLSYMDQIVYACFCLTWTKLYMPVFVLLYQIVYACFCLTLPDCICLFLSYSTRLYMPVFVLLYQIFLCVPPVFIITIT